MEGKLGLTKKKGNRGITRKGVGGKKMKKGVEALTACRWRVRRKEERSTTTPLAQYRPEVPGEKKKARNRKRLLQVKKRWNNGSGS